MDLQHRLFVVWADLHAPGVRQAWLASVNALLDDRWEATSHTDPYPHWARHALPLRPVLGGQEARMLMNPALPEDLLQQRLLLEGIATSGVEAVVHLVPPASWTDERLRRPFFEGAQASLQRLAPALRWCTVSMEEAGWQDAYIEALRGPKAKPRRLGRPDQARRRTRTFGPETCPNYSRPAVDWRR